MNSDINSDARKDPDRLEREIDAQRREINETLRALESKFSSHEIAGQFMHYFGGHGREWADSLGSSLKANPIPALLTAIGVGWLMMGDRNGAYRAPYSRSARDYQDRARGRFEDTASAARDAADAVKHKAGELGDKAAHAGDALREKAAHARDTLRSHTSSARDEFGYSAASARDSFEHMARAQPLALGAIGIALGAIIGAALPRTEHETRMLGRASERVREKGEEIVREGYERASQKVAEVAEAAEVRRAP